MSFSAGRRSLFYADACMVKYVIISFFRCPGQCRGQAGPDGQACALRSRMHSKKNKGLHSRITPRKKHRIEHRKNDLRAAALYLQRRLFAVPYRQVAGPLVKGTAGWFTVLCGVKLDAKQKIACDRIRRFQSWKKYVNF